MKLPCVTWTPNSPVYMNPTFDELVELAKSHWDTIRILVLDETNDILLASGYGNTHECLVRSWRAHTSNKRGPYATPYILFHEQGRAYMNCEDVSMRHREPYGRWPLEQQHLELLRDLVRESELVL